MKLATIGLGGTGGFIVDHLLTDYQEINPGLIQAPTVISTAKSDLDSLEQVPSDQRLWIGQTQTHDDPLETDYLLGSKIVDDHLYEIMDALDDVSTTTIDGFLFVTSLADGLGGGIPVLAERLSEIYPETSMFGLGTLPREADRPAAQTVVRSIERFEDTIDTLFLFDVAKWHEPTDTTEDGVTLETEALQECAHRFGLLFTVDEDEGLADSLPSGPQNETFADAITGNGITSVGYTVDQLETPPNAESGGLLSRFRAGSESDIDHSDVATRLVDLVTEAAGNQLSVACDVATANRVLLVVGGREAYLTDSSIEPARNWLADRMDTTEPMVLRHPFRQSDNLVAIVVASGVTAVPRIDQFRQMIQPGTMPDESEQTSDVASPAQEPRAQDTTASRTGEAAVPDDIVSEANGRAVRDFLKGDIDTLPGLEHTEPARSSTISDRETQASKIPDERDPADSSTDTAEDEPFQTVPDEAKPPSTGDSSNEESSTVTGVNGGETGPPSAKDIDSAGESQAELRDAGPSEGKSSPGPDFSSRIQQELGTAREKTNHVAQDVNSIPDARSKVTRLTNEVTTIDQDHELEAALANLSGHPAMNDQIADTLDTTSLNGGAAITQAIEAWVRRQAEIREALQELTH